MIKVIKGSQSVQKLDLGEVSKMQVSTQIREISSPVSAGTDEMPKGESDPSSKRKENVPDEKNDGYQSSGS